MTLSLAEYAAHDAVGLRELIQSGQTTADELEALARSAIASVNHELNALAFALFDQPLSSSSDGPIAGVPFVFKDWGPVAEGVPYTGGSRIFEGSVAPHDHEMMRRFRAAGLTILGATATPELCLSFDTQSRRHGITRNPWNLDRGPGGSSGGSAALVASRALPLAHGTDAAGSVRLPAACCGLVGLKPSRGRTPNGPDASDSGMGLTYDFGLTRTVRDTALLLDAVHGPEVSAKFVLPRYEGSYSEAIDQTPRPLRIAITTDPWYPCPIDPECIAAAEATAQKLEELGHHVEAASPAIPNHAHLEAFHVLSGIYTADAIDQSAREPSRELLEAVSLAVYEDAQTFTVADINRGLHGFDAVVVAVHEFFERYDLLITPTMSRPAAPHGTWPYDSSRYDAWTWVEAWMEYGPFTSAFNISGEPAISLPLAESSDGLPIGVQLVGRANNEDLLLQVSRQLELAMPWSNRVPPIWVGR